MKFDEMGRLSSSRSDTARGAAKILQTEPSFLKVTSKWLTRSQVVKPRGKKKSKSKTKKISTRKNRVMKKAEREIVFCNGVDDNNHFESLCLILKEGGSHAAERYLTLETINSQSWNIPTISAYVDWNRYFTSNPSKHFESIEREFDVTNYKKSIGITKASFDKHLGLVVISPENGIKAALTHALSPYCEATFSEFDLNFFEGDKAALKRWAGHTLFWLFTTLRPPHPVGGIYPELVQSMMVDFTVVRGKK